MARRIGEPLYEMNDKRGPLHGAGKLIIAMLIVLCVVLAVFYGGLPLGTVEGPNNRQARKLIRDAEMWENESLYNTAAEQYQKVSDNPKIRRELRVKAAARLGALQRDQLKNPRAAEAALEKAFHFAQGTQREDLQRQLEALRGRPLEPTSDTLSGDAPARAVNRPRPQPTGPMAENEVAQVGGTRITVEDILFAWSRLNGARPPTEAELEPFVQQYLDMALMASEAERQGIDARGRAALDLKLNRMMALNSAMAQALIEELQPPPAAELEQFYARNPALYAGPPILTVLPLVVRDEARARQVQTALADGEEFEALIERYAMGGPGLKPGEPFTVNSADPSFKPLSDNSGLPARLARLNENQSTGPLVTARGLAFFKLIRKEGVEPPPFERVRDQVLMAYQRNALAHRRQELLNQLRQNVPIEFNVAGLGHLSGAPDVAHAAPSTTATTATTSDTVTTTALPRT